MITSILIKIHSFNIFVKLKYLVMEFRNRAFLGNEIEEVSHFKLGIFTRQSNCRIYCVWRSESASFINLILIKIVWEWYHFFLLILALLIFNFKFSMNNIRIFKVDKLCLDYLFFFLFFYLFKWFWIWKQPKMIFESEF